MADIKWIKIVTDIFDDEKILLIETLPEADSILVIWFKLLCLAGKQNNNGVFIMNGRIAYTGNMLSTIFRRKETTVELALRTFEQFGMIEIIDDVITIPNWSKHQNFDKIEKNNEYMKNYMREYRNKQKVLAETCKVNSKVNSKVNVSALDKNREDKNRKDNIKNFKKPTLEEVQDYCIERNNKVNAEHFIDYYESNGWKVGRNAMKDWKATVRNWEKNSYDTSKKVSNINNHTGRTYNDLNKFYDNLGG